MSTQNSEKYRSSGCAKKIAPDKPYGPPGAEV
jgi:hypothetical protein